MNRWDSARPPDDEGRAQVPPNDEKVVTTPPDTEADTRPQRRVHSNPRRPRLGRYSCGWRDGFQAGAIDALRIAGRWLEADPDTWAVLEDVATFYQLAAGDD